MVMKFATFYKIFYAHRFKKSKGILKIYLFFVLPIRYLINIPFLPKKVNLDLLSHNSSDLFKKNIDFLFEFFNSDKGSTFVDQYVQPF